MKIIKFPSPNFEPRRDFKTPRYIILHYTGCDAQTAHNRYMDGAPSGDSYGRLSPHYMVHENGDIIQYVDEAMRAFHAGKSPWQGETDMNSVSIGIELVNLGDVAGYPPFSPAQITATMALCRDIMRRHPAITPQNVLGHQDIAPERKLDPGPAFPWAQFEAAGIAKRLPPPH